MRRQNRLHASVVLALLAFGAASRAEAFTVEFQAPVLGWKGPALTYHLNPANCPVDETHLASLLSAAFALWSSVPTSYLTLSLGSDGTDTVATINAQKGAQDPYVICDTSFSADTGSDGNFTVAVGGVANVESVTDHVTFGGIILNAEAGKSANIKNLDDTSLTIALAHETGHTLGLGHSADPNAIMSYSHAGTVARLGQDDVDGITYLYPRSEGAGDKLFGCGTLAVTGGSANGGNRGSGGGKGGGRHPGGGGAAALEFGALLLACWLVTRAARTAVSAG